MDIMHHTKRLLLFTRIKDFEEFVNRTDITVISVDLKVVEQSVSFQENFAALVYFQELTLSPPQR